MGNIRKTWTYDSFETSAVNAWAAFMLTLCNTGVFSHEEATLWNIKWGQIRAFDEKYCKVKERLPVDG